ncbi:MAG TPA: NUDIX domain-containing protein [Candidatus Binatia bacterium]|nr:NUDIX domain-containing protein [Candidatus Binatia bacterium]
MAAPGDDWRFCPRCGGPLAHVAVSGPVRPRCAACGFVFFSNPGVGAATVVRDARGRILMVQRSPGQWGGGKWCFPCGFVEWGEDVRAAAARETREEAGVEVAVGDVIQVASNFHDPAKPTIGIWFAATLVDPAAVPVAGDDAAAVGWFDPASPPPLAFPTDASLLARLARAER